MPQVRRDTLTSDLQRAAYDRGYAKQDKRCPYKREALRLAYTMGQIDRMWPVAQRYAAFARFQYREGKL